MLKLPVCLLALCALAGPARARPYDPEIPRDPEVVRQAQQGLYADWRACRVDSYPDDPEAGVEKMSSTVEFRRAGKKVRGVVTVGFHQLDGKEVAASPIQRTFAACVKRRFEARRFAPLGSASQVGKRWGLANPFPGYRVVENGALGQRAAATYLLGRLPAARKACSVRPDRRGMKIVVTTKPDGSVDSVVITGKDSGPLRCLRRQLRKTLRFPVVAKPGRVEVTD